MLLTTTALLKDGKVWLLLECCSDVALRYAESKSSEKPKCCFLEPEIVTSKTSERRSLWNPEIYMMLDAELQCIQWHQDGVQWQEAGHVILIRDCNHMKLFYVQLLSKVWFLFLPFSVFVYLQSVSLPSYGSGPASINSKIGRIKLSVISVFRRWMWCALCPRLLMVFELWCSKACTIGIWI